MSKYTESTKIKVCQITTVHPATDVRIFYKECASLAKAGFDVTCLVVNADDETRDGFKIKGIEVKYSNRLNRFIKANRKTLKEAVRMDADIFHFHDPEFLPFANHLIKKGGKVIYDVHEDLPRQVLSKFWIPALVRKPLSFITEIIENRVSRKMTHIITATDFIKERFIRINPQVTTVKNYPILPLKPPTIDFENKKNEITYVGSIAKVRGIKELIEALTLCKNDIRLNLAGNFAPAGFRDELTRLEGWEKVNEIGFANRNKVDELLQRSIAGLVTLHPIINYKDALPVKLFEYMAAGIPVVASDFSLWKKIVDDARCGLCVDPLDPQAIANAIDYIYENLEKAKAMGESGQQTAYAKYSWQKEEQKLIHVYQNLLKT